MPHDPYQACIEACTKCAEFCDHCARSCEREPHPELMSRCISLDRDCAAICRLAVDFMRRESEFVDLICQDCAEICEQCAEECERHEQGHCQQCAEACRRCAEECLRMGTSPAGAMGTQRASKRGQSGELAL